MPLPPLTPQTRVTAASARHDNIQFTLPLGSFHDTNPYSPREMEESGGIDIDDIAENLGPPPVGMRGNDLQDIHTDYSHFFTLATGPREGNAERFLFVRSKRLDLRTHPNFNRVPLCAGQLALRRVGAQRVTANYWANVNPTRYLRYQRPVRPANSTHTPDLFSNTLSCSLADCDELSCDGSDNWLPEFSAAIWRSFVSDWPTRLLEYMKAVEGAMRGELARRGEMSNQLGTLTFVQSSEPWRLRRLETYWEFEADSSPEFLAQFDTAMRSYCALTHVRQEFENLEDGEPRRTRERTGLNGVSFTLGAKPGVRIVAYAKTNMRIRLEVRHNFKDLRSNYGLPQEARGAAEMVQHIQRASEDAEEILNSFLTHFERVIVDSPVPSMPSPTTFLFRVAEHSESSAAAETIVRLLIMEGAVSRVETLSKSINRLRKAGILERARNNQRNQSMTYIPSPAYARAVEYLRKIANPSELTCGRRFRTTPSA